MRLRSENYVKRQVFRKLNFHSSNHRSDAPTLVERRLLIDDFFLFEHLKIL